MIEWVPIKDFELKPHCVFLILTDNMEKQAKVFMAAYQAVSGHGMDRLIYVEDALFFSPIFPYKQYESRYFSGFKVTHAAPLNWPVEKTLEEKFEEVCDKYMVSINRPLEMEGEPFVALLAVIAKQHYEGEK